jgi:hypothetical protein
MKNIDRAAIAALLSCSLMTPAHSAITPTTTPNNTTPTAEMTTTCNNYLASLNSMYAPRVFSSVAVENIVYTIDWDLTSKTSVEQPGTRFAAVGSTIVSFADVYSNGGSGVGRKGGSPNLFAQGTAKTVTASDSGYKTTDTYSGTVNYGYHCTPTETVAPSPALGFHEWTGPEQAGDPAKVNCESINSGPHETSDRGENCTWRETVPAELGGQVVRYNLSKGFPWAGEGYATAPITGTDESTVLSGGGLYTFHNQNFSVVALVCNSPGSRGGTWTAKNGYTGGAMGGASTTAAPVQGCNTPYFLVAPQISGNDFGTVIPSNSLPQ